VLVRIRPAVTGHPGLAGKYPRPLLRHCDRMPTARPMSPPSWAYPRRGSPKLESGDLSHTELGTLQSYVAALGGQLRIVAQFGDRSVELSG
jgi:hypothetical protein